jgi:hypothetical protein
MYRRSADMKNLKAITNKRENEKRDAFKTHIEIRARFGVRRSFCGGLSSAGGQDARDAHISRNAGSDSAACF